ncbi:tripartite tricarboxylate transporter substrate binding protein [Variovorax sp. M-6]|uniref:tripartite tricarboxylate transporter substrate binding protein n=1 Tax=Variovorax sp. M-6 TaxID=3233041 RepID=UPI003F9BAD1E
MSLDKRQARRKMTAAAAAILLGLGGASAMAQAPAPPSAPYPSKPVRVIVGFPAGGTSDVIARALAEGLRAELGQTIVVDNKPGVAGGIAAVEMIAAPADGYTLMVSVSGLVSELPHFVKVRFDPFKDLLPLVELASGGLVLVSSVTTPAKTLPELINYLKTQQGKSSFASYSAGTISHTLGLQLNKAGGLDMAHAAYRGSPPALTDVIGEQISVMFDGTATSIPLIKGGKLRPYAVTASKRLVALPDVPTMAEQGFPQLTDEVWVGLWGSPKLPAEVQAKVRNATLNVLSQPAIRSKLVELGLNPGGDASPAALSARLKKASDKQGALLRAAGISPQD